MCYFSFRYRTFDAQGNVTSTQTRFYAYPSSLTTAQAEAQFMALSPADQLSNSTTSAPTQSGWHAVARRSDIVITDGGAV